MQEDAMMQKLLNCSLRVVVLKVTNYDGIDNLHTNSRINTIKSLQSRPSWIKIIKIKLTQKLV